MKSYELTYIISSAIKSEEAESVKKEFETFVQEKGGVVLKSQKTVPQSLAYPVKKQSSGYVATLEFQAQENAVKPLKEKAEQHSNILRNAIIIKKPVKQVKARRAKRTLMVENAGKSKSQNTEVYTQKARMKETRIEDIEKKLDEILGE